MRTRMWIATQLLTMSQQLSPICQLTSHQLVSFKIEQPQRTTKCGNKFWPARLQL